MRKEIDGEELDLVAGGNYYINENTGKMAFDSFGGAYKIKDGISTEQIRNVCKSYKGKFGTVQEYDTACRDDLLRRGWIS